MCGILHNVLAEIRTDSAFCGYCGIGHAQALADCFNCVKAAVKKRQRAVFSGLIAVGRRYIFRIKAGHVFYDLGKLVQRIFFVDDFSHGIVFFIRYLEIEQALHSLLELGHDPRLQLLLEDIAQESIELLALSGAHPDHPGADNPETRLGKHVDHISRADRMLEEIVGLQDDERCFSFGAFFVNAGVVESKLCEKFQIILCIFKIRRQQDCRLEIPDRPVRGGDVVAVSSANCSANWPLILPQS